MADTANNRFGGDAGGNDVEALRRDLDALRKDFAHLTDSVKRAGNRQARAGADAARASAEQAQQRAQDTVRSVGEEIENRPLASLAAAFGVGLVLGRLLGR